MESPKASAAHLAPYMHTQSHALTKSHLPACRVEVFDARKASIAAWLSKQWRCLMQGGQVMQHGYRCSGGAAFLVSEQRAVPDPGSAVPVSHPGLQPGARDLFVWSVANSSWMELCWNHVVSRHGVDVMLCMSSWCWHYDASVLMMSTWMWSCCGCSYFGCHDVGVLLWMWSSHCSCKGPPCSFVLGVALLLCQLCAGCAGLREFAGCCPSQALAWSTS
eukprot:1156557-Pelagomonas_calceolata.AAC.10